MNECFLRVLLVGPERPDEFAIARRLMRRARRVVAVNPRATRASKAFQRAGGTFVRARVEQLAHSCGRFDLILENYPYPSGSDYIPPRPYALARLCRLAVCGQWILFTEAIRFATLLNAVVEHDLGLQNRFRVSFNPVDLTAAPPSHYPRMDTRFRLVFQRVR